MQDAPMSEHSRSNRPPVAIVGVSALFPGSVDSTGFWNDILAGTDRMTDVPPSHWLIDDHFDADPLVPDRTYGRRGGFLDPVDFDAMAFGVPPSVVPSTDTAQLLALIVAQRVLDDAMRGQFSELDRTRASVILGVTSGQELFGAMASRMNRPMWLQGMRRAGIAEDVALEACDRILALHPEWTESTFPGLLGNVVAGRIANRLDLGGTNCVTDAACASSFSAISMGVNELYLGDSDLVIAGGVDTMNDIFMYMCFSKTPALSKSEDIRPFSDTADGTMLGEGIGMVALKRLEDAERDGNDIYCIVNGIGASSDGRSKSVYAPVSSGQARALDNAYSKAGYGPDTVELIEAHGTGTVAGDAAEFGGLKLAFDASERTDRQWCALGTVKSQIGHTKAAAGAAGLFKVVMALHHKVLPQTAKIDKPNPKLDLENSPFHLNTTTRPWVRGSEHERRGSVSSFGFGGSNFHIALSEYTGSGAHAPRLRSSDVEMVVLCGSDAVDVAAQATQMSNDLVDGQLTFLAQTSQHVYDASKPARLAVVATDEDDLRSKLAQAVDAMTKAPGTAFSTPTGVHFGVGAQSGDVAFLFPGQGSQYAGMGADIAMNFAEAMTAWDLAADQDWDEKTLHDVVYPITSFEDGAASVNQALLTATHWAQPAIGTMSLSLLRVLDMIGLDAQHVGGHSFGEITALHAGGVLTDVDMVRVAQRRGILMAEAAQTPGSMTAVTGSIESVRAILEQSDADVVIANHNSHRQVVLSGPTDAIERIEADLTGHGVAAKRLPVATAFHSSVVSGASSAFGDFLTDVAFSAPTIPVHANETAEPYDGNDEAAMRAQLARQLSNSVRFVEMVESMYDSGARTFVEVGPSSVLTGLVGNILDGRDHRVIPLDKKNKGGLSAFHNGLGQLVAAGVEMDLDGLWREYGNIANPADAPIPKLAIPINGANYDKPYPPHDLNELAEANPVTMSAPSTTPTTAPQRATAAAAPVPASAPTVPSPAIPAVPAPAAPVVQMAPSVAPNSAVLAAYQNAQHQTAVAHTAYLNSMAQAHSAFLDAAQHGIAVLGQLAGGAAPSIAAPTAVPVIAAAPAVLPVAVPVPVPAPPAPAAPAPAPVPVAASPAPVVAGPVAAVVAVVAAPVSVEEMTPKLLGVVSDRTGYPSEMLTMDMELESDLGIDSIKRVEILSAMQDLVPELPEVDLAVMAGLATLGEIVTYLTDQTSAATPTAPTAASSSDSVVRTDVADEAASGFGRFVLRPYSLPLPDSPLPGLLGSPIAVVGDPDGIGTALVATLAGAGADARLIGSIADSSQHSVIYLGNLHAVTNFGQASSLNRDAFEAAKAFASTAALGGIFVAVDNQGGSFALTGGDADRAWAGGLAALMRTAAIEWPSASVKMIDIDCAGRATQLVAADIASELLNGGADREVGLGADGTRIGLRAEPVDVTGGVLPIGADDVVVVSGGGRGVTAATTIELARASQAAFVLLGRSVLSDEPEHYGAAHDDAALKQLLLAESKEADEKLTPAKLKKLVGGVLANREIRASLAAIEAAGGRAIYLAVDITDAAAVGSALGLVRSEVGPITGLIHGAGVLADKLIADKSTAQFRMVFNTKVEGLRNLLEATADDQLAVLCLFSSVAARTGNMGQVDYAMANDVLNKVAVHERVRRGDSCVVKSLGWGPWAGGMVTPALKSHFESMGVELIDLDVGARMLVDELSSPQTDQVEIVLGGGVIASASQRINA